MSGSVKSTISISNSRSGCKSMKLKDETKKIIANVNSKAATVRAKCRCQNGRLLTTALIALVTTQKLNLSAILNAKNEFRCKLG